MITGVILTCRGRAGTVYLALFAAAVVYFATIAPVDAYLALENRLP